MLESIGITKSMIGDLVINIVNIIILFLVTKKLLYKPLKKFLDARKEKLEKLETDAMSAKEEADNTKAEYEGLLQQATEEKTAIITEAKKTAETEAAEIVREAENSARDILTRADNEANRRKEKACEAAKDDIADAAVAIAEKILARECNDDDNRKIIDDYFG